MDTKALRQKILDLAIRGKLVPQDPNDEPASALLERIREQKRQMVKEGKLKAKDIKNDTEIFVGEDNLHYEKFPDCSVKCIEDEIPFEVPSGWEWTRLNQIASFSGGKTPSTSVKEYWGKDTLWVTSKDMKSKYIYSTLMMLSKQGSEIMQKYPANTLLMVTRSGILRHTLPVAILKKESTINQDIKAVSIVMPKLAEYIYNCLKGMEPRLLKTYVKSGVTVENINIDEFQSVLIPLAPITEMQRILNKIDLVMQYVDNLEREKTELAEFVSISKSRILDLAICGKLVPQDPNDEPASVLLERIRAEKEELIKQGKIKRDKGEGVIFKGGDNSHYEELPENWAISSLSEITTPLILNDGDWILSDNMTPVGEVKLIQLGSVGFLNYVDKGFKYLTSEEFDKLNCTEIQSGYMLINRIVSDSMNACILPDIEGRKITTVDTCWVAPRDDWFDIKYLLYAISSPSFQSLVMLNSSGTTRKRISKTNLISLPLMLPPLPEQRRIVSAIESYFALLDKISENLA